MWSLRAFLVLAVAVSLTEQYSLEPELVWPEEYHFNAEDIDLVTNIVKPFEIWYSTKHNRSRIDLYGGVVSRFYYSSTDYGRGKIFMIHPEVASDDSKTEVNCEVVTRWSDQKDFLPDLYDFEYEGTQTYSGKKVHVWKKSDTIRDVMSQEQTLLVEDLDGDVGIPLRHYTKQWNLADGSLQGDRVVNYYNYDNHITLETLDAEKHHACDSWRRFTNDFHEAVQVLHPTIESDVDLAFHRFKWHHNRDYVDAEHHARRAIFKRTWHLVQDHNEKNLGYKLGLNQFADKTMSELSFLNGMRVTETVKGTHLFEELQVTDEEVPEEFDLRTEGVITSVKNQANCGSCWAFAMAATLEGALARNYGGHLFDLSEQSLVDCAWAFRSHGCQGTEAIDAVFEYVSKHGVPTDAEYGPYIEEDGFCKINNMTRLFKIKGFGGVTRNSEEALKAAVYKHGPVTIGVYADEHMLLYRSGVFYNLECPETATYMNHAVTLVGYGYKNGELYWIVKNSWGEQWGEDGYIQISAKNNNCNVMSSPYYPIV